ncbi:MAG: acetate--CoA ligase family protein [Clostridiales bacterium]|nr:acetate--CoA ligase family protein [Clostridiales bacterium]
MQLSELYYPRGVAVSGSVSPGKLGAVLIGRLQEGGFPSIYAVNPKAQSCGDVPGYARVQDIAGPVDMIVVASPASTVASVLEDAGQKGVKAAVIISSGFGEAGHPELEAEMKATAQRYGIRYIGPNCAGMVNTHHNLLATLEAAPAQGRVALISQSGAVGGMIMSRSRREGLGIGKFVSYGNGSDLSETELLLSLKDDPETKVIAMYLENVRRGREFMQALAATTRVKPVVIVKSGRTGSGQRAALSHTGSLAGADAVYNAAFAAAGAIRAESIDDLFDICQGFALFPPITGRKVAIITNSGGPGVMAADRCEEVGLYLKEPSGALTEELKSFLPAHAGLANPLDLTVEGDYKQYGQATAAALAEYDAAIVIYVGTSYLRALPVAVQTAKAALKAGKPAACCFEIGLDIAEAHAYLREQGLPLFASGERAARVFSQMALYGSYLNRPAPDIELPRPQKLDSAALTEPEAMELLNAHGVATPAFRFANGEQEALAACRELGYPVVMKIVSPDILHKSDVGGVKLGIPDETAAKAAYRDLKEVGRGVDFRGVIVYPMLGKGREVILGFTRDPQFGPVIAFGLGGIYTEVIKDIKLAPAPLDKEAALKLIQSIKTYPLLAGVRGEAPADMDALALMLVKFSYLPFLYPQLAEADLNPVFVYEQGAVAADARLIISADSVS